MDQSHHEADTSLAEDIAIPVSNIPTAPNSRANSVLHLPSDSRRGSKDEYQDTGYDLHPIHPQSQVSNHLPRGHSIVHDTKTGKHYRKIPAPIKNPSYSLAHTEGASQLDAVPTRTQARLGLAHGFRGKAQDQNPDTRPGSTRVTPRHSFSLEDNSATKELMTSLRAMINDAVASANLGHSEELKKAATEGFSNDLKEDLKKGIVNDLDLEASNGNGSGSDLKEEDSKSSIFQLADPRKATRGPDSENDEEDLVEFPNPIAKYRYMLREGLAEMLGCFILMVFGNGINNQVFVSALYDPANPKGSYLSVSFGWGIGVAMAVWTVGGISGGILNPSLTIALAVFRKFPWKKVPYFIFFQILGAFLGSLCIYGLYVVPIRIVDPLQTETTAALFTTFPAEFLRTPGTRMVCFYNEVFATMILVIVIFAIGDKNNAPPVDGMAPLVLLWLVFGIGATLGWQTAYAVNPARDLGPRFMLAAVGYRGLFTFDAWYWIWTPTLATLVGALLGGLVYDTLIYTGGESFVNKPWKFSQIRWRKGSMSKMPAGIDKANHQA